MKQTFIFLSFYLIFPLQAFAWVTVESASSGTNPEVMRQRTTVFIDDTTGYVFIIKSSGELAYRKTTDGGATWPTSVDMTAQTDVVGYAVWYDGWTPGDSGGYIHVIFTESGGDDVYYETVNTASSDAQSGEVKMNGSLGSTGATSSTLMGIGKGTDGTVHFIWRYSSHIP